MAYCTDAFSLPSTVTLPCDTVSCAVKRSRLSSRASGLWPKSDNKVTKRLATILATRLPRPISVSNSALVLLPVKCSSFSQIWACSWSCAGSASMPSARSAWVNSFLPKSCDSECAMVLRWWRIFERARPVRTKPSHAGLGDATADVTTSTMSPLRSSVRRGTCSPLILPAMVRSPTSLCTA